MGHDVWAYRNQKDYDDWCDMPLEIRDGAWEAHKAKYVLATLRRNAFNPLNGVIYVALDAQDCNCGCSGCGITREFTRAQILAAINTLKHMPEASQDKLEPEFTFLWACHNSMLDTVLIDFG